MSAGGPATNPAAQRSRRRLAIGVLLLALLVVPLFSLVVIFPWLGEQPFRSVDEIRPEEVEEIRLHLLNHPEGRDELGPFLVQPEDFPRVLEALKSSRGIERIPPSAMLGDCRIRFKDGRRGTIRLRFQPANRLADDAPVWMEIGSQKYDLGPLGPLWQTVSDCARRAGT